MARSIVGTWRMVRYKMRDGEGRAEEAMGPGAEGRLTFTADGFFAAHVASAGRGRFASEDMQGGTDAEWAAAGRSFIAYCGRYRLEGDGAILQPELSLFPNWLGREQVRHIGWDGERLLLSSDPMPLRGALRSAHLVWERA